MSLLVLVQRAAKGAFHQSRQPRPKQEPNKLM
jgi:hypothetical protein